MDELLWCSLDNSNYLAHYGVMGMKWGVRKSIKYMNRISKGSARMNYWKKYHKKFAEQADRRIAKSKYKGKLPSYRNIKNSEKEWQNVKNLQTKLDRNEKEINKTKSYVETKLNTPLKTIKGRTINYRVYAPLITSPYVKYKVDKKKKKQISKQHKKINNMNSEEFFDYISNLPQDQVPSGGFDRTDYLYKKAGIKRKKVGRLK